MWEPIWDSVIAFARCMSCWRDLVVPTRSSGVTVRRGLIYADVDVVLRRSGLSPERQNAIFGDLQVMEGEALTVYNER